MIKTLNLDYSLKGLRLDTSRPINQHGAFSYTKGCLISFVSKVYSNITWHHNLIDKNKTLRKQSHFLVLWHNRIRFNLL